MKKRRAKTVRGFAATRDLRGVIRQAATDVRRGLEDTDCRGAATRRLKRRSSS